MRLLHLADAENRDSHVHFVGIGVPPPPVRVAAGRPVVFRRYLAAGDSGTHDMLKSAHGEDYSQALIDGDPEIDMEVIGKPVERTSSVYLSPEGNVLFAAPRVIEILFGPDGAERERRAPVEVPANVLEAAPLRWGKVRVRRQEAVRRFVFSRSVQLVHVDGLTCEYLHGLARQLDEADELVLIGAGASGREPLIFQVNGMPWRGFLEGRVNGCKYQLLLRLSNLELKGAAKP